jgi:peptide/nickel transport system substrate-binding protein
MQSILYDDQPYIMLYYSNVLEAYRTDRVSGFTPQPADAPDAKGDLLATFGPFSFISIHPASGDSGGAFTKGVSSIVWIVLLIAGLAIAVVVLKRRRRTEEEGSV